MPHTSSAIKRPARAIIQDQIQFLKSWASNPLRTGAIAPSGRALAAALAAAVDVEMEGPIVELGPGTGVVTAALLARGIAPERIYAIEYNPEFCAMLRKRFPLVNIIQGDAYDIENTLAPHIQQPLAAVISSLPLFTQAVPLRVGLLKTAFAMMQKGAPFIQFSYAAVPAFPASEVNYVASTSPWILRNLPPARVWSYRAG